MPLIASAGVAALATEFSPTSGPAAAPVVRIAELVIDPAQLDAYKTLLSEEVEMSVRVEPGVLSLSAVALKDQPTHIRLLEVYADERAYDAHIRSPHFQRYKTGTAGMVKSLDLLETTAIRLCAHNRAGTAMCR